MYWFLFGSLYVVMMAVAYTGVYYHLRHQLHRSIDNNDRLFMGFVSLLWWVMGLGFSIFSVFYGLSLLLWIVLEPIAKFLERQVDKLLEE